MQSFFSISTSYLHLRIIFRPTKQIAFSAPRHSQQSRGKKGMQKRMRCKADGEDETAAALAAVRISSKRPTKQVAFSAPRYSHSMVAGGFDDTSYTTRLTPLTLFIISFESRASTS